MTAAKVAFWVAILGGFGGFASQWLLFEPGNFSYTKGEVFIPLLGEHGIYTSRALGLSWYGCTALCVIGLISSMILDRRRKR